MAILWTVRLRKSAKRDLGRLPESVRDEVQLLLSELRGDPYALQPEPLRHVPYGYKIRLSDGRYRMVLYLYDSRRVVEIGRVALRGDVYSGLANPPLF